VQVINKFTPEQRIQRLEKRVGMLEFKNYVLTNKENKSELINLKEKLLQENADWEKSDSVFRKSNIEEIAERIEYMEKFL